MDAAHYVVNSLYEGYSDRILSSLQTGAAASGLTEGQEDVIRLAEKFARLHLANEDGSALTKEQLSRICRYVKMELYGYGIIDPLINDQDVSDIKLYDAKNIRVKVKGRRGAAGVSFNNNEEYNTFVTRLLEKNRINLGTANAIKTFTDTSQDGFILRITVISGFLTTTGMPCVAIRKTAKDKLTMADLEKAGMFDDVAPVIKEKKEEMGDAEAVPVVSEQHGKFNELFRKMVASRGILFTGKGASGKTTIMNALISMIPHDESVMLCQENPELFDDTHPDMLSTHVVINAGDSKVSYTLGDLTRAALLIDLDRVIVGEVKEGSEAAGLSKASMTGHKCWTSVHGEDCQMAIDKMADYIAQATGYTTEESLKQLEGFEYVVHLRNFNIDEIVHIDGWNPELKQLDTTTVYPFGRAMKRAAIRTAPAGQDMRKTEMVRPVDGHDIDGLPDTVRDDGRVVYEGDTEPRPAVKISNKKASVRASGRKPAWATKTPGNAPAWASGKPAGIKESRPAGLDKKIIEAAAKPAPVSQASAAPKEATTKAPDDAGGSKDDAHAKSDDAESHDMTMDDLRLYSETIFYKDSRLGGDNEPAGLSGIIAKGDGQKISDADDAEDIEGMGDTDASGDGDIPEDDGDANPAVTDRSLMADEPAALDTGNAGGFMVKADDGTGEMPLDEYERPANPAYDATDDTADANAYDGRVSPSAADSLDAWFMYADAAA